MSSCHISATPQTSSAKAIGMPSAMAPSSEPRKIAMVMACSYRLGRGGRPVAAMLVLQLLELLQLLRFLDHDQSASVIWPVTTRYRSCSSMMPDGDAEDDADAVEQAHRDAGRRGLHVELIMRLLPAALRNSQVT